MFRRDPGLRVVPGKAIALCGFGQPLQSDLNSLGTASSQQTNSIRNRSSRTSPTRKISGPFSGGRCLLLRFVPGCDGGLFAGATPQSSCCAPPDRARLTDCLVNPRSSRPQARSSRWSERRPRQLRYAALPPSATAWPRACRIRAGRSVQPVWTWSRAVDLPDVNAGPGHRQSRTLASYLHRLFHVFGRDDHEAADYLLCFHKGGPSATPAEERILTPPFRPPPMSTMFSWTFSFQALNMAYISSILAGDGFSPFPGWLRWIHRYFCLGIVPAFFKFCRPIQPTPYDARASRFGHFLAFYFLERPPFLRRPLNPAVRPLAGPRRLDTSTRGNSTPGEWPCRVKSSERLRSNAFTRMRIHPAVGCGRGIALLSSASPSTPSSASTRPSGRRTHSLPICLAWTSLWADG